MATKRNPPSQTPPPGYEWKWSGGSQGWTLSQVTGDGAIGPNNPPSQTPPPGYTWKWVGGSQGWTLSLMSENQVTGPTGPTGPTAPTNPFSAVQLMEQLLFSVLGIRGLGQWAAGLANQGASPTEIVQALRYGTDTSDAGQTAYSAYLAAFPQMDKFLREGIFAGESPELQYIEYRNTIREAAERYEIDSSLVTNDRIAQYIGGRNSAAEIVDRMNMAATAVATTPPETISILRDYYGVNSGDLVSFYLDPDETEAMLTKRYTAARIGTEAARQRFGVSRTEAEDLAMRGITAAEAEQGFAQASQQTAFMEGFGETATREDILGAAFGSEAAAEKVTRIAQSRMGRFQEGGGFAAGAQGVSGLGASTTR